MYGTGCEIWSVSDGNDDAVRLNAFLSVSVSGFETSFGAVEMIRH